MPFSDEKLIRLVNNLPGLAYRCLNNENWTMLFVSEGCYGLTGYRPDELVGDRVVAFNSLIPKDYRELIFHQARKALKEQRQLKYTYPITHKSGKEKWVYEQAVGIYAEDGEAVELEGFISDITQTVESEKKLERANIFHEAAVRDSDVFCDMIGRSQGIRRVFNQIINAAQSDANVIIYGESGTGKEMVARAIHDMSGRSDQRLVPVNCGAIPDNLIESEFFGYKKGAFSGALTDKLGFLDQADGGSLFLDEVGEINPNMQIKMLRAVEDYGFTPIGGKAVHKPNVRIIAATNKNLQDQVKIGKIREDFFFRIHVISIHLPPLRERKEDIPLLAFHFLKKYGKDKDITIIPQDLTRSMMTYDWPGNVRELQNFIYRYIAAEDTEFFKFDTRTPAYIDQVFERPIIEGGSEPNLKSWMRTFEKQIILKSLEEHKWHRGHAARALGIHYRSLLRKMRIYDINLS